MYFWKFIIILPLILQPDVSRTQVRALQNEKFVYAMRYRGIPAANATLTTTPVVAADGSESWHLNIRVKLNAPLKHLFYLENQYQAIIDRNTLLPTQVTKTIHQRNVRYQRTLIFHQDTGQVAAVVEDTTWQISQPIFDLTSLLFRLRLTDPNFLDTLRFHIDCELPEWLATATPIAPRSIKTRIGEFLAAGWSLKFLPVQARSRPWKTDLLTNQTVKDNAEIVIWLSDDSRRIPLQIQYFRGKKLVDLVIQRDESR